MSFDLRRNGPSLPPPQPKSPPRYPDLYGKRRELTRVQMLEREIGFLQEELKSMDGLQPASVSCKEVADFVTANADPLIPTSIRTKKIRKSCRFWKWLCGVSYFSMSWLCCCNCSTGRWCCCCDCIPCNCCSSNCKIIPKCECFSCCNSKCFTKWKCRLRCCSCSCCIPKCPSCQTCSFPSCECCPKCPSLNICSCNSQNSCCCHCNSCFYCM